MTLTDIAHSRLQSQQIAATKFQTVKDLVGWMGAMQAQDYPMAKWAIGIRLPDTIEKLIEAAIDKGEIIRTHILRPTWHFVSAEDIYWMLELTAPKIKSSLKSRHKELEISDKILIKSNELIEKALVQNKYLTREELIAVFQQANIPTDNNRASHLLFWAELSGLIGSGAMKSTKTTYSLLEERVPKTKSIPKEEALAKLACKYFSSHGPANLQDFLWWSGLSASDAKNALELVKSKFISEIIDGQSFWVSNSFSTLSQSNKTSVYLLPAFDEFIISYKDRSAVITYENHKKTVSNNGIFRPVIVVNGEVNGIWKRGLKNDKVVVETNFFQKPKQAIIDLVEVATQNFGNFLDKKVEIKHKYS